LWLARESKILTKTYLFPCLFLLTVVGYEEYALTYPPEVVIKWIQALFAAFDDIVDPRHALDDAKMVDDSTHDGMNVVKFETFHDFYFLVSGCPEVNTGPPRGAPLGLAHALTRSCAASVNCSLIETHMCRSRLSAARRS
jgi:hypothetical protein